MEDKTAKSVVVFLFVLLGIFTVWSQFPKVDPGPPASRNGSVYQPQPYSDPGYVPPRPPPPQPPRFR
jgi:hypothetical protein